jgi:hypothetical protein
LVDKLEIPKGVTLEEFLTKELQASTLSVRAISTSELYVESEPIVRIHVQINERTKSIDFDLYSPRWGRRITVQQLGGFEFMESQAEDLLLKENADAIAEDSLLALDIIRLWASKNGYTASEVAPLPEGNAQNEPVGTASKTSQSRRSTARRR